MKTRIFTTAAMFILTTGLVEGTTQKNDKDTTSVLAYVSVEKIQPETNSGAVLNSNTESNAFVLENWIAGREAWEQEGTGVETTYNVMETVNLEEWVSGREAWEQESEIRTDYVTETFSLEEWIAGREQWERQGTEEEIPGHAFQSDILEKWITGRESWEQK